jgi:hypothetical protein
MTYTVDDLTVFKDPLEFISKRPNRFLRTVSGVELAAHIVAGASLLTDRPVTLVRKGSWWVVAGEQDWMQVQPGISVNDLFTRIVSFPQAGPNSLAEVVTASGEGEQVIKGTISPTADIWQLLKTKPEWKRIVAFRMSA